jgi:hypothetical protein
LFGRKLNQSIILALWYALLSLLATLVLSNISGFPPVLNHSFTQVDMLQIRTAADQLIGHSFIEAVVAQIDLCQTRETVIDEPS